MQSSLFRPSSSGNSSSKSSFTSRKSPLSRSSSFDDFEWTSSRTSQESVFSNVSQQSSKPSLAGKRSTTEPLLSLHHHSLGLAVDEKQRNSMILQQRLANSNRQSNLISIASEKLARKPGETFKQLPEEILLAILRQLRSCHLDTGTRSCATCWARDANSLGMSCSKWYRPTKTVLYEDIQLNGNDSLAQLKHFKMKYGTRLVLLRRTLMERPELAGYVRTLKFPAIPDAARPRKGDYLDLIASVIMACPNLERVPGIYEPYNHEFSKLSHALSTRKKLAEVVWSVSASPSQHQQQYTIRGDVNRTIFAPSPLSVQQCHSFVDMHLRWPHLRTLFLHCNPGGSVNSSVFLEMFRFLSVQHLYIAHFPAPSFNDENLLALPPLKSLRLESLPGVSSQGMSNYASSSSADTLESLTLVSIPVQLPVVARLLAYLKYLRTFKLQQGPSPTLPQDMAIYMYPYLASSSLEHIHWEMTDSQDSIATDVLAKSISASGFPALRRLRAPTDFTGTLQRLCRPCHRIVHSSDKMKHTAVVEHVVIPRSQTMPIIIAPSRTSFFGSHKASESLDAGRSNAETHATLRHRAATIDEVSTKCTTSLASARIMAQKRIAEASSSTPQFHVIVWDDEGNFLQRFALGTFMGKIESNISYNLEPDIEGSDNALVGMTGPYGLLEGGPDTGERCSGLWAQRAAPNARRKSLSGKVRGKGWHMERERGRGREMVLQTFFK